MGGGIFHGRIGNGGVLRRYFPRGEGYFPRGEGYFPRGDFPVGIFYEGVFSSRVGLFFGKEVFKAQKTAWQKYLPEYVHCHFED